VVAVPIILSRGGGVEDLKSQFAFKVTQTADQAFGSLVAEQQAVPQAGEALGKGGGGPVGDASRKALSAGEPEAPVAMPVPANYRVNYNYVYKGDDFTIDNDMMPVFQKVKDSKAAATIGSYLGSMNLGALDLGQFKNTKVDEFTIVEDRTEGYRVTVQLKDGSVSIQKNWEKWPQEQYEQLSMSDIPEDEAMIAVADKFIRDYGIDMTNYGEGKVSKDWMRSYGAPEMGGQAYVPGNMSVVYPLLVDGIVVYDRNGYEIGLRVNVDIKQIKAVGLWDLNSQSYESSLYEVETDVEKILETAQAGQRKFYFDNPTKTLEFELGTPKQALMRVYNYENGASKQFLAPCLIFPVTKAPDEAGYYQENIVVPLTKELLENESAQGNPVADGVRVTPPMPEPAVEIGTEAIDE